MPTTPMMVSSSAIQRIALFVEEMSHYGAIQTMETSETSRISEMASDLLKANEISTIIFILNCEKIHDEFGGLDEEAAKEKASLENVDLELINSHQKVWHFFRDIPLENLVRLDVMTIFYLCQKRYAPIHRVLKTKQLTPVEAMSQAKQINKKLKKKR